MSSKAWRAQETSRRVRPFSHTVQMKLWSSAAVVAILVGTLLAPATTPLVEADPAAPTATVLRVVDGDTVDIVDDVRGRVRIRLLGIDTPETKKSGYTVGCWGPEATQFAESTLAGQRVALVTDPSQGLHDRYGRTYLH